jgi:hypothetical protein
MAIGALFIGAAALLGLAVVVMLGLLGEGPARKTRFKESAVLAGIAVVAAVLFLPSALKSSGSASNERGAAASLKTIASAQEDFRANDRDGNGLEDYWRRDVAGLGNLIDRTVAEADDRPIKSADRRYPRAGYWFRALRFADERDPDPQRFAACAFPESPSAGRRMFIISHEKQVWWKAAQPGGIEVFPAAPEKEGWEPIP